MKGADAVMANIVQYNDWLDEEVMNTSRLSHAQTHTHTHSHTCAHTHTHTHAHTHSPHTHTHTLTTHTHTHSVVTWQERDSEHWLWVNEC